MKPVCIPCQRFMRPVHNGYYFLEGMPVITALTGTAADLPTIGKFAPPGSWKPYKLWSGDLWGCPDCGAQIVVGTGREPISEHYLPDFAETTERFAASNRGRPMVLVKDC